MKPKVLLDGLSGKGNLGDDLIVRALVERLPAEVTVLSDGDLPLLAVPDLPRHDASVLSPAGYRALASASDVVLFGGGSLLKDFNRSHLGVQLWVRRLGWALRAGRRAVFAFVGVDELDHPLSRRLVRGLRCADLVIVRDRGSRDRLARFGVVRNVLLAADPVAALRVPSPPPKDPRAPLRIGVNLRPPERQSSAAADPREFAPRLAAALAGLTGERDLEVVLIPFRATSYQDDRTVLDPLGTALREAGVRVATTPVPDSVEGIASLVGSLDLLIAMRFHALVLSLVFRVPFLALSYAPKVSGLLRDLGCERAAVPFDAGSGEIAARMRAALAGDPPWDTGAVRAVADRAATGFDRLASLLGDPAWVRPGRIDRLARWVGVSAVLAESRVLLALVRSLRRPAPVRSIARALLSLLGADPGYFDADGAGR
jgi:polysaccharide pyruvyl transferase WcaK-like protein